MKRLLDDMGQGISDVLNTELAQFEQEFEKRGVTLF